MNFDACNMVFRVFLFVSYIMNQIQVDYYGTVNLFVTIFEYLELLSYVHILIQHQNFHHNLNNLLRT